MRFVTLILLAGVAVAQESAPNLPALPLARPAPQPAAQPAAPASAQPAAKGAAPARTAAPAPAPPRPAGPPSPRDLKYPAPRLLQPPAPLDLTLSNGLRVLLLEDHDVPAIGGAIYVRTGTLSDPPQRIGLARIAGLSLRSAGTTLKSPDQVDGLLDAAGATLDANVSGTSLVYTFTGVAENTRATLDLLAEMLIQPGFRQERLDAAKTAERSALARRNDAPPALVSRELASLIYGQNSPFGWHSEYATVDPISSKEIRGFHQRYVVPANVILGIWGDFKTAEMKTTLEAVFGRWTARQPAAAELPKVKDAPSPGVFLAEKNDLAQSYFAIGHLGGLQSDKDSAALEVLVEILGGGDGRIAHRVRDRFAIAGPVSAAWRADYSGPGLFEISGTARTISTVATIAAIKEEIERLRTAEPTEDELRRARDAAIHRLAFSYDSRVRLFLKQVQLAAVGYPLDFLAQHQKALAAVTGADLLRVAKQRLRPADLTIVIAANPRMLVESFDKLGPVTRLDLTIPPPQATLADTSEESLARGRALLAQAQAATGGAAKLAAVKDYVMLAEYRIDPAVPNIGGSKVAQTDRWVAPTTFRQESLLPSGRIAAYTDGKIGWISTPQGWGALAGTQRNQVMGDLFRIYFRILLSDRIEGRVVTALDDNTIQISDSTGQSTSVEFDPATHLPKRFTYDTPQAVGAPIYSEDAFDDYRDVDGIKVPFRIAVNQGGHRFADCVVTSYQINTGQHALDLVRRPQ
jgi:zinc protease